MLLLRLPLPLPPHSRRGRSNARGLLAHPTPAPSAWPHPPLRRSPAPTRPSNTSCGPGASGGARRGGAGLCAQQVPLSLSALQPALPHRLPSPPCTRAPSGLLMDKVDVNGRRASPVWAWLRSADADPSPIPWSYTKFLVARDGSVVGRYPPRQRPAALAPVIRRLLAGEETVAGLTRAFNSAHYGDVDVLAPAGRSVGPPGCLRVVHACAACGIDWACQAARCAAGV